MINGQARVLQRLLTLALQTSDALMFSLLLAPSPFAPDVAYEE